MISPEGVKRRLKEAMDGLQPDEVCEALDRFYIEDESNDYADDKMAHYDESEEESNNDEQGMQEESETPAVNKLSGETPHGKEGTLDPEVKTDLECLRILTGKKHRQIKLQRLEKVRIWAFGLLVH